MPIEVNVPGLGTAANAVGTITNEQVYDQLCEVAKNVTFSTQATVAAAEAAAEANATSLQLLEVARQQRDILTQFSDKLSALTEELSVVVESLVDLTETARVNAVTNATASQELIDAFPDAVSVSDTKRKQIRDKVEQDFNATKKPR